MLGKLAIVYWNDPCFQREVSNISSVEFVPQTNVGWVTFIGEKVLIVNAFTEGSNEVTLVHQSLVTKVEPLEVKNG